MLIDTHCHLTYPGLAEQTDAVVQRALAAGVGRMITIGTQPADHPAAIEAAKRYPSVFVALGIHPHHAAEVEPGYEAFIENFLRRNPKALAVGECGLDYHYDLAPKLLQRGVFINQLEMARRLNLPVILHMREAHKDGMKVMQDFLDLRFVVHCFTGTPEECTKWLEMGAYIGITGIVTYKNAADVQASVRLAPAERLLVETDAPYLSPEPVRKIKINEPAHVAHVAAYVAQLRGSAEKDLADQTTANAARLFGEKLITGL